MYRKNCGRCNRPSYSSSEFGEWKCPICGHDLTDQPFFNASTFEKVAIIPRWKKNAYKGKRTDHKPSSDLWG